MSGLWPLILLLDGLFLLLMVKRTLTKSPHKDTRACGLFLALVLFIFLLDLNSEISFAVVDREIIEQSVERFDPISYAVSNTFPFYANEKWRSDLLCASFSCMLLAMLGLTVKRFRTARILISMAFFAGLICFREFVISKRTILESAKNDIPAHLIPDRGQICDIVVGMPQTNDSVVDASSRLTDPVEKWRGTMKAEWTLLSDNPVAAAAGKNAAANELFSLPELPDGVVADLARMFRSPDEDEVWRDYCLQFLGSALERTDGVTDADRALARETLAEAIASTNATFAGTALRALHRGDPADPLVASNALRIARDPSYSSASRTTALLVLEECVRAAEPREVAGPQVASPKSELPDNTSSTSQPFNLSTLAETAAAVSADPSASSLLRQTADAVLKRLATDAPNP